MWEGNQEENNLKKKGGGGGGGGGKGGQFNFVNKQPKKKFFGLKVLYMRGKENKRSRRNGGLKGVVQSSNM